MSKIQDNFGNSILSIHRNPNVDQIWCEEGGRMFRITIVENNKLKIETIDVTEGWPGKVIDTVTLARFRLQRINQMIEKALSNEVK